jgi:hypothetical protein
MKLMVVAILSLTLCACGPARRSAQPEKKNASNKENGTAPKSAATITADPNPVPPGGELGATTITWDTGSDQSGEVYVSENGGPEKRFVAGSSGSHNVKWVRAGKRYEFRLYEGSAHSKMLANVLVTRPATRPGGAH